MNPRSIAIGLSTLVLLGCASTRSTPIPAASVTAQRGQSAEQQARDGAECQQMAESQTGYSPAGSAARGAGVGAAVGALGGAAAGAAIGAASGGDVGKSAGIGAGAGAATGAVGGGAYNVSRTKGDYNVAFASCMEQRGYRVEL